MPEHGIGKHPRGHGVAGGYLTSPRLKDVHWQARGREVDRPRGRVAGESALYMDPGEIPGPDDVAALGHALATATPWRGWTPGG